MRRRPVAVCAHNQDLDVLRHDDFQRDLAIVVDPEGWRQHSRAPARVMISLASVFWPTVTPLGLSTTVRGRRPAGTASKLGETGIDIGDNAFALAPSRREPPPFRDIACGLPSMLFGTSSSISGTAVRLSSATAVRVV